MRSTRTSPLGDVRLTMGGEPTFVSTTDRDADEWNIAALGPTKRARATDLLFRLKQRYGANGFVHMGQGKWYPGEQLPRWTLGCYWRADGHAAWTDPSLFADEQHPDGHVAADAERFITALASRLGVTARHVQSGYEDVWYYLWRERKLPVNVDPFDARLDDEVERDRLRRVFTQGLDAVVGYALPIRRVSDSGGSWATGRWFLRDERLYLIPGDSPMGLRLPLDSLPWSDAGDLLTIEELDPLAPRAPLPVTGQRDDPQSAGLKPGVHAVRDPAEQSRVGAADASAAADVIGRSPSRGESAAGVVRSALCVEPRGGVLFIFMPPVKADRGLPRPRRRSRSDVTRAGHARAARRLSAAERSPAVAFQRHAGSGSDRGERPAGPGLGSARRADDDALRGCQARGSFAREVHARRTPHRDWRRQSFCAWAARRRKTARFFGAPTCCEASSPTGTITRRCRTCSRGCFSARRARRRGLMKVGTTACTRSRSRSRASRRRTSPTPPWFVDRALRHLLVDVAGNTHRAEFCIDKLYSPDLSSGRRGLLEMRAFEMPPDARMSVAQQLLIRALIARFWREPYTAGLTRWGTELHDRFMLPYFIALDFDDVIEELGRAGYELSSEWFAPHFEFRFPLAGELAARAIHLTLRQALEPWHVLGEEGGAGGTARFVDSSLERMQLLVTGLAGDRFVITCNGRTLPLHPTGRNGEFVAGVRYRAWQPPSALHPTIPVHTPLTFDIVDTWMERSVAGCQYHVMHPGGRSYDVFPVNSYEAESRRLARFTRLAHTPGPVRAGRPERSLEFPYTLDLRTPL